MFKASDDSKLNSYVTTEAGSRFLLEFKPDLVALLKREVKGAFMIVERAHSEPNFYAQACWDSQDKFTVEFRDGSHKRHYRKIMTSAEQVFTFFEQWLGCVFESNDWERVDMPANVAN